jgi:hypothetical protein
MLTNVSAVLVLGFAGGPAPVGVESRITGLVVV